MGDNLPPGVSISDSDAPWNQDYPEPDYICRECGWGTTTKDLRGRNECPECGAGIRES